MLFHFLSLEILIVKNLIEKNKAVYSYEEDKLYREAKDKMTDQKVQYRLFT